MVPQNDEKLYNIFVPKVDLFPGRSGSGCGDEVTNGY
jgi:hypothetical protein